MGAIRGPGPHRVQSVLGKSSFGIMSDQVGWNSYQLLVELVGREH